jgi:hypothetical protein
VRFYLRATDEAGQATALGSGSGPGALKVYVTERMPVASMPAVEFGRVRSGETVMALPWGTGPKRAGLELGNGSDSEGPPSFDVDAAGRIFLLDGLQGRVAVFAGGRLVREIRLPEGSPVDVAVGPEGSATVLSREGGEFVVRRIDASGAVDQVASLGEPVDARIAMAGDRAFADLFPLDGWTEVPSAGSRLEPRPVIRTGRPLPSDQELLRVARPHSLRLALVSEGQVRDAVEIRSSVSLGEAELAEPDGGGGFWAVLRVWREGPDPADQYQVVDVRGSQVLDSFAVSSRHFAVVPPFNRFRLGADGYLYHLMSSPEGIRVERYQLGGDA